MPYQEHGMWEVLEVLNRLHSGEKRRSIARHTGRSRSTIDRYVVVSEKADKSVRRQLFYLKARV